MIWFAMGAVLGAIQLGLPILRKKRQVEGPFVFIGVGAILGALVYGTILWLIGSQLLGL